MQWESSSTDTNVSDEEATVSEDEEPSAVKPVMEHPDINKGTIKRFFLHNVLNLLSCWGLNLKQGRIYNLIFKI